MTDIFISYKREERDEARRLAEALGARGYSVWWDAEILPGEQYRAVTLQILESCHAAIVIWSQRSTSSNWVLDEAQRALDRGVLVPVHLEPISGYPLGFGQVHAHDLVGWGGGAEDAKFQPVLAAIDRLVGAHSRTPAPVRAPGEAEAEIAFWRGVQDSNNVSDFEAYLSRYQGGLFAELAQRRIDVLGARPATKPPRKRARNARPAAIEPAQNASVRPLYQAEAGAASSPAAAPPVRKPDMRVLLVGSFDRWELGFIAAVALISPFVLWPIVNSTISNMQVFYPGDHLRLLDISQWRNVFLLTPVLTAMAWVYDFAERWLEGQTTAQLKRIARYALFAILALLYLTHMRAREDYAAHSIAWIAVVLAAALVARRAAPSLKRQAQALISKGA